MPADRNVLLDRLLEVHGHVLTTARVTGAGFTVKDVHRLTASGRLVRLRRGALVDGPLWRSSAPWVRHALRARAVAASLMDPDQDRLALSHHSALAMMDLSTHGVDDRVHLSRVGSGKAYRTPGLHVHGAVDPVHTTTVDGVLSVSPALACLQVAATFGVEAGLVAADSALRTEACSAADLEALLDLPVLRTGRRSAQLRARRHGRAEASEHPDRRRVLVPGKLPGLGRDSRARPRAAAAGALAQVRRWQPPHQNRLRPATTFCRTDAPHRRHGCPARW